MNKTRWERPRQGWAQSLSVLLTRASLYNIDLDDMGGDARAWKEVER